jgi:adenine phosphoribosyltransferase
LPAVTIGHDYSLEYGADRLEIHTDAITPGEYILLVDDLIATAGTAQAALSLLQKLSAVVVACAVVIDLPDLGGAQRLRELGVDVFALCQFDGD